MVRVRTVVGSCWSCKKRRIRCDLGKPGCVRCSLIGASCDYGEKCIRWNSKAATSIPAVYQANDMGSYHATSLAVNEKRALEYFHGRLWPLFTTASEPCSPPIVMALQHRVLLLAICVISDGHRILQDGRNDRRMLKSKHLECLAAVRGELDTHCQSGDRLPVSLLLAVLFLYFHGGYMDCTLDMASTASHHAGVRAIIAGLGGIEAILDECPEPLHMLLSEFASADLTTTMIKGGSPAYGPAFWLAVDKRCVWWSRDPLGRSSLASVFSGISRMIAYQVGLLNKGEGPDTDRILEFEALFDPVYIPVTSGGLGNHEGGSKTATKNSLEIFNAFSLIRAFQLAALIYLRRAVCGLPTLHPLVQQHVLPCLDCILDMVQPTMVFNCVIFPLLITGAHVQSLGYRRKVRNLVSAIHRDMKFCSVQSAGVFLDRLWASRPEVLSWYQMFAGLNLDAVIL
ncbi:hypothetical protein PFICI_10851 [Pestalotiopsis fici W106-1]|uniref:Zn(2)-C6 fungal-type domain-containing protein n=1 Tax=Pestalotiopsis fici (strain W106-1 / CGMCC3.15140) TaxID=1229662 RepID=W3WV08_PESFW|nr:uncharacterized protein PFICI_10851 [Pestalotiopsis fici W106-1]ETS76977.1 hypothetical protein PFICI_10851 [Pestalotiopsis fici W106-1]